MAHLGLFLTWLRKYKEKIRDERERVVDKYYKCEAESPNTTKYLYTYCQHARTRINMVVTRTRHVRYIRIAYLMYLCSTKNTIIPNTKCTFNFCTHKCNKHTQKFRVAIRMRFINNVIKYIIMSWMRLAWLESNNIVWP